MKHLVDRSAARVASFASDVAPENPAFVQTIEELLAEAHPR